MRKILFLGLIVVISWACGTSAKQQDKGTPTGRATETEKTMDMDKNSFHALRSAGLSGDEFSFSQLKGKRILIVNTASECGYTPQYAQLQELYDTYKEKGFVVVGFPSNDFGGQEPGTNEEIGAFCQKNYGVSFPMMAKTSVLGEGKHPVYVWLTEKKENGKQDVTVSWNFNKFLIDESGQWVAYYPSNVSPLDDEIMRFAAGSE